jgi:hypothetical protein
VKKGLQGLKNKTSMSAERAAREDASKEEELKERHILALEELATMSRRRTIAMEELVDQVARSAAAGEATHTAVLDVRDALGQFVNNYQAVVSNYWFAVGSKLTRYSMRRVIPKMVGRKDLRKVKIREVAARMRRSQQRMSRTEVTKDQRNGRERHCQRRRCRGSPVKEPHRSWLEV